MTRLKELADTDKEFMANFKAGVQERRDKLKLDEYYKQVINNGAGGEANKKVKSAGVVPDDRRYRSLSFKPAAHSTPGTYVAISKSIEKLRDPNTYAALLLPELSSSAQPDSSISFTPVMRGLKTHPRTKIKLGPQDHIPLNATLTSLHTFNANGRRIRTSTIASLSKLQQLHELAVFESLGSTIDESVSSSVNRRFQAANRGGGAKSSDSAGALDFESSIGSLQQRSDFSQIGFQEVGNSTSEVAAALISSGFTLPSGPPPQLTPNLEIIRKPKLTYKDAIGL